MAGDKADGNGRSVDAGLEKALEDSLVEVGIRSAGEEAVELHEEEQIYVL